MSTSSALFWAGMLVIGAAVLSPSDWSRADAPAPQRPENQSAGKASAPVAPPMMPSVSGIANQRITRSPDGNFYLTARLNGVPTRFLVDTGASIVALSSEDARRANVFVGRQAVVGRGAGGNLVFTPVRIDSLAVDGLTARSVRGALVDTLEVSLLGQSFLSQLNRVEIDGDTMILR